MKKQKEKSDADLESKLEAKLTPDGNNGGD